MGDGMHLMIPAEEYTEMEAKIERLEKALDKACVKLAELCFDDGAYLPRYCPREDGVCQFCGFACEKASIWKEWCMKDANR